MKGNRRENGGEKRKEERGKRSEASPALGNINAQMCAYRSFPARDMIVDRGTQEQRLTVRSFRDHGRRAAAVEAHAHVDALSEQQICQVSEARSVTIKRLAAVHDKQVKITAGAIDAEGRPGLQVLIIETRSDLALDHEHTVSGERI